jgi:hypothetical protein
MKQYEAQIDAYVRGELSPAEQSVLELEILENPVMLMEFEIAVAMRKGTQQLELPLVKEAKSSYWWQSWIGRPMVTGVTMAVAVVALVQLATLSSRGDLNRDAQSPTALSANVPILTFSRIRSARENTDFSVVASVVDMEADIAVLELEIDWPPQPVYEVTIAAQDAAVDATAKENHQQEHGKAELTPQVLSLNPDARGYLVLAMPTRDLPAGDYLITIKPGAASSMTDDSESVQNGTGNKQHDALAQVQQYTLRVKSTN